MSAPDPDSITFLGKIMAGIAAVVTPLWGVHKWIDGRLDKKADKSSVEASILKCAESSKDCLRHIEKLYQNAEKDRALTRDLHDKAMERISQNQTQIISALTKEH